jgi:uncharacterized protein YijF (DUF1287 family)
MQRRAVLFGLPAMLVASGCRPQVEHIAGKAAALVAAAHAQTRHWVTYDAQYTPLSYPEGDVPLSRGVCADVVVRAYRGIGIDLQRLVHEDMSANFHLYPDLWGLKAPDSNIDHRRVPNLRVFFSRFGHSLPVTRNPADYQPGDIVTTRPITRPHIAIVSDTRAWFGAGNLMVIQNKGFSTRQDNELLSYEITGHYRYGI